MQETKQRTQRHDRQLRRAPPQPRTDLHHERAHLGHVHTPELQPLRAVEPRHERANLVHIAAGGRRHQATLLLQIPAEVRQQLLHRSRANRRARRWCDAQPAQIPQQRTERLDRHPVGVAGRAPRRAEALRDLRRQPRRSDPLGRQKAAQPSQQRHVLPHRHRPEPLAAQVIDEPGSERPKRTGHPNPRHASHPDRLLSANNTSKTISARALRLCTPPQSPITQSAKTSQPERRSNRRFP